MADKVTDILMNAPAELTRKAGPRLGAGVAGPKPTGVGIVAQAQAELRTAAALLRPSKGYERAFVLGLHCLAAFADAHAARYGGPGEAAHLGDDCVLGPCWVDMLTGLLALRNGEMGRLDASTLGTLAHRMATEAGFDAVDLADVGF